MAEKEKQSEHKSTIDKYFSRTADGFKAWAEEDEEERNYLLVAIEPTGDVDEDGNQSYDLHISSTVKPIPSQAELVKQCKRRNSFAQSFLQQLENSFLINKKTFRQ